MWHPSFDGVRWVDMHAGDILELVGTDEVRRTHVGTVAAAFRPRRGGGIVLADQRGFALLDADLRVERRLPDVWDDPGVRMNEGGADPAGNFWCGSMAYDEREGAGALYRLTPDLSVEKVLDGVTISNGLGLLPRRHARLLRRHPDPEGRRPRPPRRRPDRTPHGLPDRRRPGLPRRVDRRRRGLRVGRPLRRRGRAPLRPGRGAARRRPPAGRARSRRARSAAPRWTGSTSPRPGRASTPTRAPRSRSPARCSASTSRACMASRCWSSRADRILSPDAATLRSDRVCTMAEQRSRHGPPAHPGRQVHLRTLDRRLAGPRPVRRRHPAARSTRSRPCTASPSSAPTASPSTTTTSIPFGTDATERDQLIARFRAALDETGLVVPMMTTNLFTHPVFKDGGFTSNDRAVRRFALRKVMRNLDLAAELGATTYVFWGGREGAEDDPAKDIRAALDRYREGIDLLAGYVMEQGYGIRFAIEPKPNEPRGDILLPTVGHALAFIAELEHGDMVGLNPEVGHEQMAGLNFTARHRAGAVGGQALPHRPQRPARRSSTTRTSSSATATCSTRSPWSTCWRTAARRRPGLRRARGTSTTSRSRTEDIDGVWVSAAANMRTYLLLKERAAAFRADPEVQRGARRGRGRRASRRPRSSPARPSPTCSPTAARSRTSTPTRPRRARLRLRRALDQLAARARCSMRACARSVTASPSADRASGECDDAGRRGRLVDAVVQGRHPRRRHRRARPAGARAAPGRHRGRPGRVGGRAAAPRSRRPAGSTTSRRSPSAASSTAWCASTTAGAVVRPALLWNDTRSAQAAADLVAELGGAGVGRRRRHRAGRLVHRHQAALARRPRAGQRRRDGRGLPAARLAHLAAARGLGDARRPRRPDHGPLRRQRHRLLVAGRPARTDPTCSSAALGRATSRCRACWRPARRPAGTPPGSVLGPGTGDNAAAALGARRGAGRRRRLDRHVRASRAR